MKIYKQKGSSNWFVSYYDNAGQRVRRSLGTPDKALAEALVREWEQERFFQENFGRTPDYSFDAALCRYLKGDSKQKRSHACDISMSWNLRPHFGGKTLRGITTKVIAEYVEKRRGQGVANSTINRDLALLRVVLRKAHAEWEWLDVVPSFPKLKEPPPRARWLTAEEMERLVAVCPPHLRAVVITAFNTGGRIGEILGLRWSEVDLERKTLRFLRTKNDQPRGIPMNARLVATLSALKAERERGREGAGAVNALSGNVFTYKGEPIGSVKKSFARACVRAGIEDFHIHDTRHTFASHLVQEGVPLLEVKELLGHKTLAMVMRYAHLAPDNLRGAVERLPGHSLGIVPQCPAERF